MGKQLNSYPTLSDVMTPPKPLFGGSTSPHPTPSDAHPTHTHQTYPTLSDAVTPRKPLFGGSTPSYPTPSDAYPTGLKIVA